MVWLIMVGAFGTGFLFFLCCLLVFYHSKLTINNRLELFTKIQGPKSFDEEKLSKPFVERVIKPIIVRLTEYLGRLIPAKKSVDLQKRILMAGTPGGFTAGEFVVIGYCLAVALAIGGVFLTLPSGSGLFTVVFVGASGAGLGLYLPRIFLQLRASQRQTEIQKNLPDVLDLLTVSVEAGLGFDAALYKVIEKTKGVLADEFNRMLQEIKMGKPRREALRDMGHHSGNEDLQSFIGSLVQADQLGVSIGNVLRLQSEQMRGKRRQLAEEKAMKAPIKMLIPLVLFIFPTLFIVLIGPAALQFVSSVK